MARYFALFCLAGTTFATNPASRIGGPDQYYSNKNAMGAVRITIVMVWPAILRYFA